jgi:hypothetical protein
MRLYFGLITAGLIIAALSRAALSWDGSYYLFKVLDSGQPFLPPNQFLGYLFNVPLLLFRIATDDMIVLQAVFGLTYAAVPLIALAACWWVVRQQAPALFVWPAFGIGVGLLPGMFYLVGAGWQVVALFWPVLLATMLGLPRSSLLVVVVCSALVFLAHPAAVFLFVLSSVVAVWTGMRVERGRRNMLVAAATFGLLAVARIVIYRAAPDADPLAIATYTAAYEAAVRGYPLIIVGAAVFAAATMLWAARLGKPSEPEVAPVLRFFQFVGLGVAGALALDWARHPPLWANALQFTDMALLMSLPFILLTLLEGAIGKGFLLEGDPQLMSRRLPLIQGTAIIFVAVLSVQSILFSSLADDLYQVIAQSAAPCISTTSLGSLHGTPLGHWSVSTLGIALQSRSPQKLLLDGEGCVAARSSGTFRVVEWDAASGNTGWFDLSQVRARAGANRDCWYSVSPGWYGVERGWYADWWRWSSGQGQVRIFVGQEMQVTMRSQLRSVRQPNRVEILLNGQTQAVENHTSADFVPMAPLLLTLRAGENTIEVRGGNAAVQAPNDSRSLALAIKNLDFNPQEPGMLCELQP